MHYVSQWWFMWMGRAPTAASIHRGRTRLSLVHHAYIAISLSLSLSLRNIQVPSYIYVALICSLELSGAFFFIAFCLKFQERGR